MKPWRELHGDEDEGPETLTTHCLTQLTVYDLSAEDHEVYAHKEGNRIDLHIVIEDDEMNDYRESIPIAAWDSLVSFARQIVSLAETIG